jgi:ubiquinone/menaquinone biosynthesis C-methylase UbiE
LFLSAFSPSATDTILDIGVSGNDHISSNYLERHYRFPGSILALGVAPHPELRLEFPSVTLLCGDARRLPLADGSVDYVHSHAVIEHVGSRVNQARFLAEACRVARKGVFITTPNRWHPVESHTGLPLLHYLPASVFRAVCQVMGKPMYATEENLNLLGSTELRALAEGRDAEIQTVRWLGFVSNLVLVVRKSQTPKAHRR